MMRSRLGMRWSYNFNLEEGIRLLGIVAVFFFSKARSYALIFVIVL